MLPHVIHSWTRRLHEQNGDVRKHVPPRVSTFRLVRVRGVAKLGAWSALWLFLFMMSLPQLEGWSKKFSTNCCGIESEIVRFSSFRIIISKVNR